ncbi:MAG: ABC transporter ATP-binding protein [Gemmatimonadales bacterium]
MLEVEGVHRRFGSREVLGGVSLEVPAGRITLVVGANGCGKSTLARLSVGLLKPSRGSVRVGGEDPRVVGPARRGIGFVGHQSLLYADLTAEENLAFTAKLYGVSQAAGLGLLDRLEVGPERRVPVRTLSRGMMQRVALARALVANPGLLVLDEPLTGLDAPSAERLVAMVGDRAAAGAAVLMVSHELHEVWRLEAGVAVLHGGRIAHSSSTAEPLERFRTTYGGLLRG